MECPNCMEDRNYFTEMHIVTAGVGVQKYKRLICHQCLGWERLNKNDSKKEDMTCIQNIYIDRVITPYLNVTKTVGMKY